MKSNPIIQIHWMLLRIKCDLIIKFHIHWKSYVVVHGEFTWINKYDRKQ